jgi:hypothetical protein
MRNRWTARILAIAAAFSFSPVLWAQNSARPGEAKNTPDLSGIWTQQPGRLPGRFGAEDVPLQPWALEIYKANRQGVTNPRESGLNGLDPEMYCLPEGIPRVLTMPPPFELVQAPGRIYMLFQSLQNPLPRYIYTDGQGHPDGYPVTAMGHSIGRWDGDTLVVDTVAIDEVTWLDDAGTPHSDALHVVERLRRVDHETLEIEFRFEDPKAFTKPWTAKKVYKLTPDWQYIPGFTCEDRFKTDFANKTLRDKKDWIEFHK